MKMHNRVELPLVDPIFSTYQLQGSGAAIIDSNPSIRNWYLNESIMLRCDKIFLRGWGSPYLKIENTYWTDIPLFEYIKHDLRFIKGYTTPLIKKLINSGYYVYFEEFDDYYIENKSWYKERHLIHDGLIYGYDRTNKTFALFSYNKQQVYCTFDVPQNCLKESIESALSLGKTPAIYAIKPLMKNVNLSLERIKHNLVEYMSTTLDNNPVDDPNPARGVVVQEYLLMYFDKLIDGSIKHRFMDYRLMRLIWEHKKVMLERIEHVEKILNITGRFSEEYKELVVECDTARLLYASHHLKQRDSLLPIIKGKMEFVNRKEREILKSLLDFWEDNL